MSKGHPIVIVACGDSITAAAEVPYAKRWLTVVGNKLRDRIATTDFTLINAGVGGETSGEGLLRLEKDVLAHRPGIVIIGFGANDATREDDRHVSEEEFGRNLLSMAGRIRSSLQAHVVLLNIVPIIDDWHGWMSDPFFRQNGGVDKCLDSYRNVIRQFAARNHYAFVDIYTALRQAIEARGPETVVMPDGVHLTQLGNGVVADEVCKTLVGILTQGT